MELETEFGLQLGDPSAVAIDLAVKDDRSSNYEYSPCLQPCLSLDSDGFLRLVEEGHEVSSHRCLLFVKGPVKA